jgi:hypothetical protein
MTGRDEQELDAIWPGDWSDSWSTVELKIR